jgi:hypothetical protein
VTSMPSHAGDGATESSPHEKGTAETHPHEEWRHADHASLSSRLRLVYIGDALS